MIAEWQQLYQTTLAATALPKISPSTVLILDKSTHMLPWESMPILQGQSVSRLPTWTIWRDNIMSCDNMNTSNENMMVNAERTQYLLNPAGDLLHTEGQFAPLMKQYVCYNVSPL
jgi:separase